MTVSSATLSRKRHATLDWVRYAYYYYHTLSNPEWNDVPLGLVEGVEDRGVANGEANGVVDDRVSE